MKKKKPSTEEFWQEQPQTYQTGSTKPPKSHSGIIAFLLALVIFLCGISTALGLLNIHLFRQLSSEEENQQDCAVAFSDAPQTNSYAEDGDLVRFSIGFSGQSVPDFWQYYHDLPQGIYVAEVEDFSAAQQSGLLPGDILTQLNGIPVPDTDTLTSVLHACVRGQSLDMEISREGNSMTLTLTVD